MRRAPRALWGLVKVFMPSFADSTPLELCRLLPNRSRFDLLILLARALGLALLLGLPAHAQSDSNPSGLPLPRFVTTRSEPINVRVGPGTRYDIAWTYTKAGLPVEIVQEFDTWRKIRDMDGDEGWVHQNLLSGRRTALIVPPQEGQNLPLRRRPETEAPVNAWLGTRYVVDLDTCDGQWCEVLAAAPADNGRAKTYKGFVPQSALWGVYPGETIK